MRKQKKKIQIPKKLNKGLILTIKGARVSSFSKMTEISAFSAKKFKKYVARNQDLQSSLIHKNSLRVP